MNLSGGFKSTFWTLSVVATLAALAPADAFAQAWPNRPLRLITGFAAGGPTDLLARLLAPRLQESLGQPVIVEARPGASGNLAMEQVAKAPPDGTLFIIAPTSNLAVNPHLFAKLPYDPMRDYAHIITVATIENVLVVHPAVPAKNVAELLAFAKSRPGQVTFGSPANGSQAHLAGEAMNQMAGVQMVHVPYKGSAPAMNDLLGGQITMMFVQLSVGLQHMRSGKVRAIGIGSKRRAATAPEVPTLSEQGLGDFEAVTWYGLLGPTGTPREIVQRFNTEMNRVLRDNSFAERFAALGTDPGGGTPEELTERIRADLERWGKVVRAAGIKPD
jgi:tripartite-type tricarboxylate transporter receptor subunit TctC